MVFKLRTFEEQRTIKFFMDNRCRKNQLIHQQSSLLEQKLNQRKIKVWFFLNSWLRFWTVISVIYLLHILALFWLGCSGPISGILAFLPGWIWLIPIPFFFFICTWRREWWGTITTGATICIIIFGIMGFQINPSLSVRSTSGWEASMKIVSNNYGQRNRTELDPFLNQSMPDLVFLQEAYFQGAKYKTRFAEYYVEETNEFVLLSRYPILSADPIIYNPWNGRIVVIRYVLQWGEISLALYHVHFPTPRQIFEPLRSRRFFGLLPSRQLWNWEFWQTAHSFWENQYIISQALAQWLQGEKLPWIMVGDFNTPPFGRIYRLISKVAQDSFNIKGQGFGFTFPGSGERFLKFPWLRLDYIWLQPGQWDVNLFLTEEHRPSQHRAILAQLTYKRSTQN